MNSWCFFPLVSNANNHTWLCGAKGNHTYYG
nr:MAG TPA: hypothetical protein [Caudoviricetes sp.]